MMIYDIAPCRALGIYDVIRLSTFSLDMDKWAISATTCFWSSSCNSPILKCGMMSPTILDVVHLTGLPFSGQHISALLTPKTPIKLDTDLSYEKFQTKYLKFGLEPTDKERTVFYLLWLSQFLV